MLHYAKTYENTKTINQDFPIEDAFYATDDLVVVADGITRDPVGISDFKEVSFQDFLDCYPRPSGAELAAKEICSVFASNHANQSLLTLIEEANKNIRLLNQKYVPVCDYLENDYYGAVCASISIDKNILYYAYICDCGVIVYDRNGNIKFQTEDDKLKVDSYIAKSGALWNLPSGRVKVRKEYRNQPNHYIEGALASYGALTGEKEAIHFIKSGSFYLDSGDIIIVYSDGFTEYFKRNDFYDQLKHFKNNIQLFDTYVENVALLDYEKYGKEKTIVVLEYI